MLCEFPLLFSDARNGCLLNNRSNYDRIGQLRAVRKPLLRAAPASPRGELAAAAPIREVNYPDMIVHSSSSRADKQLIKPFQELMAV